MVSSGFDPRDFLLAASRLVESPPSGVPHQATLRTAAGRAYYAVHGYIATRLATARGMDRLELFQESGRHGPLLKAMAEGPKPFAVPREHCSVLLTYRVQADYCDPPADLREEQVESAVDSAQDALEKLEDISDEQYRALPLSWLGHPSCPSCGRSVRAIRYKCPACQRELTRDELERSGAQEETE